MTQTNASDSASNSASNSAHSAPQPSDNLHPLANFDFVFNGALEPEQVHEIATAAFVERGENLLLVGGPGTGKSVIANAVSKQATALGLSVECLDSAAYFFPEFQSISRRPGYIGSTDQNPGLRRKLLDCDLLLVDEADEGLGAAPTDFLVLLGRRIELGKSNILMVTSDGWKRLQRMEGFCYQRADLDLEYLTFLLGPESAQRSQWGMMMVEHRFQTLQQLLTALGINFTVQTLEGEQPLQSAQSAVPDWLLRWQRPSPFVKEPVWHQLYTGENNYPKFLRDHQ